MSINRSYAPAVILLFLTILSSFVLSSSFASADDSVVDDVSITVPTSCTMRGTGMNSHNATINNGTYNSEVGTTTLRAFCNDNDGFAIYAIGYTNNTDGNTVLASQTLGSNFDIATGTQTSGNSQWAMKLATDSNATYPIELQNGFGSFHTIPDDYTLVAKRTAGTDIDTGESATGSTLTTTYQVYISNTQSADTYIGKVKYVMVHPNTAPQPVGENQIGVIYDGNGLFFDQAGTQSTNRVVYEEQCENEYGYVGENYQEAMSSNITIGGQQNGAYTDHENVLRSIPLSGADKLKVVIEFGITADTMGVEIVGGDWDGDWDHWDSDWQSYELYDSSNALSGTETFFIEGDTVTIYSESWATPETGYDKGFYARVYPVYNEPTEGANYSILQEGDCTYYPVSGAFTQIADGGIRMWYLELDGYTETFDEDEEQPYDSGIINYLLDNRQDLKGTTIILHASNSYTIVFDANGGSGTMANQVVYEYAWTSLNDSSFTKPHQEVASWNTEPDGTGETYAVNTQIFEPIVKAGESMTLYAQWGLCRANSVCYDDNDADSPTKMANHRFPSGYNYSSLWASNFQRPGYGFAGWNTEADGTGVSYGPNQVTGITNIGDEGIRFYAMWVPSAGVLQNWAGCSSMNIGDVTALTDTRDNNTYAVAKLADGNCWMIENLRLGNSSPMTLTTANTQSAGTLPAAVTSGSASSDTEQLVNNRNTSLTVNKMTIDDTSRNIYSRGNLYTWAAAINSTQNISSGVASTSICPSGWHLPYGGNSTGAKGGNTSGGFYYLGVQLGATSSSAASSQKWRTYPNNFLLSESYSSSTAYLNIGQVSCPYHLFLNVSSVAFGSTTTLQPKTGLRAIRCVANQ